jgi:hypothetical protein
MSVDHRRAHVLVGQNHIKICSKRSSRSSRVSSKTKMAASKQNSLGSFGIYLWQLVPCPAVQLSASDFLSRSTPLFKEKRDSLRDAPISNLSHPSRIDVA